MTRAEKTAIILNNFNNGKTVVIMTHKHIELYSVIWHSENMLLNALNSAVAVRLI
mgnify:CR=1 FL=1